MTQEEALLKAENLSKSTGKKVYPVIITVSEAIPATDDVEEVSADLAIAFIKEPSLQAKMDAYDKMIFEQSLTLPGQLIFDSSVMKEESDERFFSTNSSSDPIKIGAYRTCTKLIEAYAGEVKKK